MSETKLVRTTGRWRLLRAPSPVVGYPNYILQYETDNPALRWRNAETTDIDFAELEQVLREGGSHT